MELNSWLSLIGSLKLLTTFALLVLEGIVTGITLWADFLHTQILLAAYAIAQIIERSNLSVVF